LPESRKHGAQFLDHRGSRGTAVRGTHQNIDRAKPGLLEPESLPYAALDPVSHCRERRVSSRDQDAQPRRSPFGALTNVESEAGDGLTPAVTQEPLEIDPANKATRAPEAELGRFATALQGGAAGHGPPATVRRTGADARSTDGSVSPHDRRVSACAPKTRGASRAASLTAGRFASSAAPIGKKGGIRARGGRHCQF